MRLLAAPQNSGKANLHQRAHGLGERYAPKLVKMLQSWQGIAHNLDEFYQSNAVRVFTLVAVAFILFLRKPDALFFPQFWAEDGAIFFKQAYETGLSSFITPYAGYLHFIPRCVALGALAFSPAFAPAIYNFAALLLTVMVGAKILSRRLNLPYKPLLALALVCIPHSGEVFLTITNIQWFTAVLLLVLVLQDAPETAAQSISDFIILIAVGLSGPFIVALAPLFFFRLLRNTPRRAYDGWLYAVVIALCLIQGGFVLSTMPAPPTADASGSTIELISGWCGVIKSKVFEHLLMGGRSVMPSPFFWLYTWGFVFLLWQLLVMASVVLVTRGAWLELKSKTKLNQQRMIVVAAGLLLMAAVIYKLSRHPETLNPLGNGDRYFYLPRLMVIWFLITCLQLRHRGKWGAAVLLASVAATIWLATNGWTSGFGFQSAPYQPLNWEKYSPAIESGQPVTIPINPPGWFVTLNGAKEVPR